MKRQHYLYQFIGNRHLLTCLLFLFCSMTGYGQGKADFTPSKESGCVPLYVQFTNNSDQPAERWEWTFGTAAGSTLWNPGKVFDQPGEYMVTLTVKYAGQPEQQVSKKITVYKNPEARFTPSVLAGCMPLAVTFTDNSSPGDGTITKVTWDFGDGTSGTGAVVSHTFSNVGKVNVSNIIENTYGCTNGTSQLLEVQDAPVASFSSNGRGTCQSPPYTVKFFNTTTSPGSSAMTYEWDFGDGTKSTEEHPQHVYAQSGAFTVTLTAKTSGGCTHTIREADYIAIQPMKPDFEPAQTACTGTKVTLMNTTKPAPQQAIWTFPDGSVQNTVDAVYTFATAGSYTVKMRAIGDGCEEEISKVIQVAAPPAVSFTASPNPSCEVPSKTQFNSQTGDATRWAWSFGDGTTSNEQNPLHSYQSQGNYTVTLVATNAAGCRRSVTSKEYIKLQPPAVTITPTLAEGCLPYKAGFTSSVTGVDAVASYLWHFGDGGTSTDKDPTHTYTTEGDFKVTLEVTTKGGCKASAISKVSAGQKPVVDFDANIKEACQSTVIKFSNLSKPRGTSWYWKFPQDDTESYDEQPTHQFQHYGKHDVVLVVKNYGCTDRLIKKDFISIWPPVSQFKVIMDCEKKLVYQFKDESEFGPTNPKSWKWDFGDGTPVVTDQHPSHTYKPGQYKVVLKVSDGHCESTNQQVINVVDEDPTITVNANSMCIGADPFRFTIGKMNYENILVYRIYFGDGTGLTIPKADFDPSKPITKRYSKSGAYKVYLEIEDINRCRESSNVIDVTVNGVIARFDVDGQWCKDNTLTFKDASSANDGNKITNWTWRFFDKTPDVDLTTSPTKYEHAFKEFGRYPVRLVVKDDKGCMDSVSKEINIATIRAIFSTKGTEACLKKDFTFFSNSQGATKFKWEFGDGNGSEEENPKHQYQQPGEYKIKLVVMNSQECKDSISKDAFIKVGDPRAEFSFPSNLAPCPPVLVDFTNTSTGAVNYTWDFGDQSTSTKHSPTHAYNRPGTYPVTLTVKTEGGCANKATKDIFIQGPDGKLLATPSETCLSGEVTLTAIAENTVKYIWDFDEGTVKTTTTPKASYTYARGGIYYPRLILEDNRGCQVPALPAKEYKRVLIDTVKADFATDPLLVCAGGVVKLTNKSNSVSHTREGHAMRYAWDFGVADRTDDVSDLADPKYTYNKAGDYTIKLVTTTAFGCKAEHTYSLTIEPQPKAEILSIAPVCVGSTVQLAGRETEKLPNTKWTWQIGNDPPIKQEKPLPQKMKDAGDVPVQLTIRNANDNCPYVAQGTIKVLAPPVLNPGPMGMNICRGASLQLQSNTAPGTKVTWTDYQISDPRSTSPRVSPLEDATYHVEAIDQFGCVNKADVLVTVTQPHKVQVQDAAVCSGKSVQLHASGASRYQWLPATGLSRADVADPMASPDNTTTYQVVGFGKDGCFTDTVRSRVTVNPSPQINAGKDQTVPVGSEIRLQAQGSMDIVRLEWQPATGLSCTNCLQPLVTTKTPITYHVTAVNQYGCTSTDDVNIKLVCQAGVTFLPNTFTPNGDGQNDVFYIRGRGIKLVKVFRIFNRWGAACV